MIRDDKVYQLSQDNKSITICSDGSVYPTTSGGAWVIVINGEIAVIGINGDTGPIEFQNSYRSEAHGLLSGLIFIQEFHKYYDIPQSKTRSICDSKGLIIRINNNRSITKHTAEADILNEIYSVKTDKTTFAHVKGHQDTNNVSLSEEAYINVIADLVARSNISVPTQVHPPNQISIYVNHTYVPHSLKKYMKLKLAAT